MRVAVSISQVLFIFGRSLFLFGFCCDERGYQVLRCRILTHTDTKFSFGLCLRSILKNCIQQSPPVPQKKLVWKRYTRVSCPCGCVREGNFVFYPPPPPPPLLPSSLSTQGYFTDKSDRVTRVQRFHTHTLRFGFM